MRTRCRSGHAQLWLGTDAGRVEMVAVTEIALGQGFKVARIWLLAGKGAARWISEHLGLIEAWARHEGCEAIEQDGRPGFQRRLPREWRPVRVCMRKELR